MEGRRYDPLRMHTLIRPVTIAATITLGLAGGADAQVKTTTGTVRGATSTDGRVRSFKGIPYAAPPVGDLRWQAPQAARSWDGVRDATEFGRQCMQGTIFGDITFPHPASEDCLTLNVWTPASPSGTLPVMVWIHGGGFQAGAGPEPRHDGDAFVRKEVVLVTINYRLGVFGFFSHPELSKESGRHASGNYGMLDQVAALQWVRDNIAAFGGDPGNVTIFGESAGSFAVSALMASPVARGLFHKAIGESGAYFGSGPLDLQPLPVSEQLGVKFAGVMGADSLAALRAKPAEDVLAAALKTQPWFAPNLDGYFLTEDVATTFAAGRQARVPLLAGWNADEVRSGVVLAKQKPTAQSFSDETRKRYGQDAEAILKAYPATSDAEALESAASLASDLFIGYGTWKWIDTHARTGQAPVFRYSFDRKIPVPDGEKVNGMPATSKDIGARHAGEIEYVFGTLDSRKGVPWQPVDRTLSEVMTSYWAAFATTGEPKASGLPEWPRFVPGTGPVLHFDEKVVARPETQRQRYEALERFMGR